MLITSTKNEIVKSVRRLRDRSARRESGQHLIEGERLVFDALEAGIVPETLFIEHGRTDFEARVSALGAEFFSVSRAVLETVCDTSAPQGIAAAVRTPDLTAPESAEDFPHGLIAALDALQDPGNLGTIIRTPMQWVQRRFFSARAAPMHFPQRLCVPQWAAHIISGFFNANSPKLCRSCGKAGSRLFADIWRARSGFRC